MEADDCHIVPSKNIPETAQMDARKRHNNQQAKHADSCRRSGRMAIVTLCGACDKPVVGVVLQKQNRYAIECKSCGYSAIAQYRQAE
jgi:hypothetical protein